MALTPSTMLPLGTALPAFQLTRVSGCLSGGSSPETLSHVALPSRPVLFMLLCAHCPFVMHVEPELSRLERDFGSAVTLLGIASNSINTHPQDGPEGLRQQAMRHHWTFPYLLDEQQTLAKELQGACTPEFFLFAPDLSNRQTLRYRGQLDGSRPGNEVPLDGRDLRAALDAVLKGEAVSEVQQPSIGCNIKWHPGQEPPWFGTPA
ncbi:thioredoxin family protein [Synechococcus sp. A15-60]|uniref:thioredoxin family protein n=1 Tax=Synechococcus sp. A15-60 TaxID=1050655 RepID=UPI0016479568|nr:thioredoxin family protein [Synechococcus sp. A15-60]QNI46984.1 thioredoxin domain-containing protein [Synechococcus sp. A15-60]